MNQEFSLNLGGKEIKFEIKGLASRANAEVMVRSGDTQILVTAVMSENDIQDMGFFPLTVNYEERYYAAGKILGSRYVRREGKPSDNATLTSRLIDRAIRPLFDQELPREIQVIITCFSLDEENDPDILGLLGASLALLISDIPWQGPLAAVRIGLKNNEMSLNPTYQEREEADLDIIWTGLKHEKEIIINMVEASAKEVSEDLVLKTLAMAQPEMEKLIEFQQKIVKEVGKEKATINKDENAEKQKEIEKLIDGKIEKLAFGSKKKLSDEEDLEKTKQINQLEQEIISLAREEDGQLAGLAKKVFEKKFKQVLQEQILKNAARIDGRRLDEIRELNCQAGLIPRAHGSGLFCRGLTKALSILTLGGPRDEQLIEGMEVVAQKRFLHHYNFPPYSVGEVSRLGSPSRREIGHGMLAEKALTPLIPDFSEFPYTIRIVSEIVSSNGSTSMASVCSSSLALMDAGVPLKAPVAGIAMGIVSQNQEYKLLTDIQGWEDFFGGMDFKVAGTKNGITAIQADLKIKGLNKKIIEETLIEAKRARLEILNKIQQVLAEPRKSLSPLAPKIFRLQISPEKIGEVIGPKGQMIKRITEETNTEINIEDSGEVFIVAHDEENARKAIDLIRNIAREMKVGENFIGTVKKIIDFGAFLNICPGHEGLLHSSQFGSQKPRLGDKIEVKIVSIDELGRINLGLKGNSQTEPRPKFFQRKSDR